ncbi:hypothetical protein [Paludisphaera rhizosphaerae]|uniref:hypothetical protein n=1 Tax=Paludisphaera rhizosphaerae TaxID=2711216 RepID=UPI0013EE3283|nr:hypothetical protein [Paludisphaera rhizosphaerae]
MSRSLFDDSFPPPEPEGLGKVEIGVETMADGRRVMTVKTSAGEGEVLAAVVARLTEKGSVDLANAIARAQFLAWPMVKG